LGGVKRKEKKKLAKNVLKKRNSENEKNKRRQTQKKFILGGVCKESWQGRRSRGPNHGTIRGGSFQELEGGGRGRDLGSEGDK